MNFSPLQKPEMVERRSSERYPVICDARLQTPGMNVFGELVELSAHGARFIADRVPRAGASALLEWDSRDSMCEVVWSDEGVCGLKFDRPITLQTVQQVVEDSEVRKQRANLGNIKVGTRRRHPLRRA